MPPASRASSTPKSRYSISPLIQDGLPWSVFRREFRDAIHYLDESFLLSKGGECRFGLDLVEFFEAFIERPVEVGDGEIFVPAGRLPGFPETSILALTGIDGVNGAISRFHVLCPCARDGAGPPLGFSALEIGLERPLQALELTEPEPPVELPRADANAA